MATSATTATILYDLSAKNHSVPAGHHLHSLDSGPYLLGTKRSYSEQELNLAAAAAVASSQARHSTETDRSDEQNHQQRPLGGVLAKESNAATSPASPPSSASVTTTPVSAGASLYQQHHQHNHSPPPDSPNHFAHLYSHHHQHQHHIHQLEAAGSTYPEPELLQLEKQRQLTAMAGTVSPSAVSTPCGAGGVPLVSS